HAPARPPGGVNSRGNQRSPRTLGEQTWQRRSGRQSPKERRPNAMIARMLINETVAKALIDTRVSDKPDEFRHQLREYLPRSEVTQNEHHRNACAKFA